MIADDEDGFAQIQGHECHHIALAGFIDDHHIEAVVRGSKFSTTCDSGMTQTGTAPRHWLIFLAASVRRRETRTP